MRRKFFRLLAPFALLATAGLSPARAKACRIDKRLIGTWRSDKERTLKQWCYNKEVEPEKRERFENIFGKLTIRFTNTHAHTEMDGLKQAKPYTVVATDDSSVLIRWHEEGRSSLQHIHFHDGGYYVLSGYNVEFFARVSD